VCESLFLFIHSQQLSTVSLFSALIATTSKNSTPKMFSFGSRRMTLVAALLAVGVSTMHTAMALPKLASVEAMQETIGGRFPKDSEEVTAQQTADEPAVEEVITPLYESVLPTTPAIAITVSENTNKDIYLEMKIDENNMYTLYMGIGDLWTGEIVDMLKADIVLTGHRIVNGQEQVPVEYLNMNMAEMIVAVVKNNSEKLEDMEEVHPVNLVMDVIAANLPATDNTKFWEAMSMVTTEWITRTNVDTAAAAPAEPAATDAAAPAGDAAVRHLAAVTDFMNVAFKASRRHGALRR
jgi:hypothetical protein